MRHSPRRIIECARQWNSSPPKSMCVSVNVARKRVNHSQTRVSAIYDWDGRIYLIKIKFHCHRHIKHWRERGVCAWCGWYVDMSAKCSCLGRKSRECEWREEPFGKRHTTTWRGDRRKRQNPIDASMDTRGNFIFRAGSTIGWTVPQPNPMTMCCFAFKLPNMWARSISNESKLRLDPFTEHDTVSIDQCC